MYHWPRQTSRDHGHGRLRRPGRAGSTRTRVDATALSHGGDGSGLAARFTVAGRKRGLYGTDPQRLDAFLTTVVRSRPAAGGPDVMCAVDVYNDGRCRFPVEVGLSGEADRIEWDMEVRLSSLGDWRRNDQTDAISEQPTETTQRTRIQSKDDEVSANMQSVSAEGGGRGREVSRFDDVQLVRWRRCDAMAGRRWRWRWRMSARPVVRSHLSIPVHRCMALWTACSPGQYVPSGTQVLGVITKYRLVGYFGPARREELTQQMSTAAQSGTLPLLLNPFTYLGRYSSTVQGTGDVHP